MAVPHLLIDAAAGLFVGIAFMAVGLTFWRRPAMRPADATALRAFAAWWLIFGFQSTMGGARILAVALGNTSITLFTTIFVTETALAMGSFAGAAIYLRYLWVERLPNRLVVLIIFGGIAFFYALILLIHRPEQVIIEQYSVDLKFMVPFADTTRLLLLAIYVSLLAGMAVAFWILGRGVTGSMGRRTRLVVAMVITIGIGDVLGLGPWVNTPWVVVTGIAELVLAGLIWWAYRPPSGAAHPQSPNA